jgi:hypothetical protein
MAWAYQCCQTAFPETKPAEWEVKEIDAPGTGGFCFIDLMHNSTTLDFAFVPAKDRPEAYGPFIRVTNSYNGLRALAFDIGFFRKVCKNGLILPKSIIRFRFIHSQRDIREKITFDVAHERLTEFKSSLNHYLETLHECQVTRAEFAPLSCAILRIRKPKETKDPNPAIKDWIVLVRHLNSICGRYIDELGENAYAVFNAITDFASHPPENRCLHRDRHSLQRLAGAWVSSFSKECRQPGFKLSGYLKKLEEENSGAAN